MPLPLNAPVIRRIPECLAAFSDGFCTRDTDVFEQVIVKVAQLPPLPADCQHVCDFAKQAAWLCVTGSAVCAVVD